MMVIRLLHFYLCWLKEKYIICWLYHWYFSKYGCAIILSTFQVSWIFPSWIYPYILNGKHLISHRYSASYYVTGHILNYQSAMRLQNIGNKMKKITSSEQFQNPIWVLSDCCLTPKNEQFFSYMEEMIIHMMCTRPRLEFI